MRLSTYLSCVGTAGAVDSGFGCSREQQEKELFTKVGGGEVCASVEAGHQRTKSGKVEEPII